MDRIDQVFAAVAVREIGYSPTIACLYTGPSEPSSCAPMLRSPEPAAGMVLDAGFANHLVAALALNAAVHDGAVMVGRNRVIDDYRITGWSYRLFPPSTPTVRQANRGSAFNSCLAMSVIPGVDRLYLVSRQIMYRFEGGTVCQLALSDLLQI